MANAEVERGIVGRELDGRNRAQTQVAGLQSAAEGLLVARWNGVVEEYGQHHWRDVDRSGRQNAGLELMGMVELATDWATTPAALIEADLSPVAAELLDDALTRYRESLPYASAECRWLGKLSARARREAFEGGYATALEWMARKRGGFTSGGQVVPFEGRHLINRGWDWMRVAGRFKHGSTYEVVTRNALRRIGNLFDDDDTHERWATRTYGREL